MIPFHKPCIGQDEINAVTKVMESGWMTSGPTVQRLESKFSELMDGRECVATNSATSALLVGLKAIIKLGLKGDEVIMPAYTFVSTANVVRQLGLKPVFCDVDPLTLNAGIKEIQPLITNNTTVIMVTHFAGVSCDMKALRGLVDKHNIILIEDCAHCLPTLYKGKHVGSRYSDLAFFSFYATKTICGGEGGMLVTPHKKVAVKAKTLRLHGMTKGASERYTGGTYRYDIVDVGYKCNMTDITAAIVEVQLDKMDHMMWIRIAIAAQYQAALKDRPGIVLPKISENNSHHLYPIQMPDNDFFIGRMKGRSVCCSHHFIPITHFTAYEEYRTSLPVTDKLATTEVSLPIYPSMKPAEIDFVIHSTLETLDENAS